MKKGRIGSIIQYVREHPGVSSSEIITGLGLDISPATIRRDLTLLVAENKLSVEGQNKGTKYFVSPTYDMFAPIDVETYFKKEIDQRKIIDHFNFELLSILTDVPLFTKEEYEKLTGLQQQFRENVAKLTLTQYKKEMERLAVDLSWKSSQIEGNTYSLLETERLLLEKETASGKSLEEATMLLNHKEALDYLIENPHYLQPLTVAKIENIHSILIQDLDVDRNIRTRRVGITGTNYRPLDNEFQIREALDGVCNLVNSREDIFEKALLLLILISYIQPFNDGNKRTARIVSNAELMANDYCPISFRTVDSIDYKKAMLIFYEQNNISAFKKIFIDQFEFAVSTYF
ncbi:DeoR family transcriptional regulator [Alistipes indistinctus]|uniref:Fic family protein n=1 Tax=Alistipes indistinctus TaxID=626932 RepID=UPI000E5332FA|nr:Fic family protein [Alistipes indistinctus]RGU38722.1 DeoR family transcriptional regulator [Alistipes indistinctus]